MVLFALALLVAQGLLAVGLILCRRSLGSFTEALRLFTATMVTLHRSNGRLTDEIKALRASEPQLKQELVAEHAALFVHDEEERSA